jgi:hypothetical protein
MLKVMLDGWQVVACRNCEVNTCIRYRRADAIVPILKMIIENSSIFVRATQDSRHWFLISNKKKRYM